MIMIYAKISLKYEMYLMFLSTLLPLVQKHLQSFLSFDDFALT